MCAEECEERSATGAYQLKGSCILYKVAVRPAMLYGLNTVALAKRQKAELEVA